jgi:hypothetical protein
LSESHWLFCGLVALEIEVLGEVDVVAVEGRVEVLVALDLLLLAGQLGVLEDVKLP